MPGTQCGDAFTRGGALTRFVGAAGTAVSGPMPHVSLKVSRVALPPEAVASMLTTCSEGPENVAGIFFEK